MVYQVYKDGVPVKGELYTGSGIEFFGGVCHRRTPLEQAIRGVAIMQHHDLTRNGGKLENYTIRIGE